MGGLNPNPWVSVRSGGIHRVVWDLLCLYQWPGGGSGVYTVLQIVQGCCATSILGALPGKSGSSLEQPGQTPELTLLGQEIRAKTSLNLPNYSVIPWMWGNVQKTSKSVNLSHTLSALTYILWVNYNIKWEFEITSDVCQLQHITQWILHFNANTSICSSEV